MEVAYLLALALVLALISVLTAVIIGRISVVFAGRVFQGLIWLLALTSVAGIVLSGRTLQLTQAGLQIDSDAGIGSALSAKILLGLTIGVAVALCAAFWTRKWWPTEPVDRFIARGRRVPNDITYALLLFYFVFSIVPLIFASQHYFHVSLVYPFFIFLALLLWLRYSKVDPVAAVKQTLIFLVLGSLVAALIEPELAIQPGHRSLVPGVTHRLWGITASANTLGSVALALLLIELCEPIRSRWIHVIVLLAALAALVLSQSKAALIAGLVSSTVLGVWRWSLNSRYRWKHLDGRSAPFFVIGMCVILSLTAIGLWLLLDNPRALSTVSGKLESSALADLATATGRVDLWIFAYRSALDSPIFGHGADFWSADLRARTGLSGASHAHNQVLQVFTRSGVLGVLAYLWFFFVLFAYAWRAASSTRGGSVAILLAFFIRSIVEVPFQPNSVLGGEFFAFMMLLIYVMDRGAAQLPTSSHSATVSGGMRPQLGRQN